MVESAGTSGYHLDEPPDRRATAAAKRRGIDIKNRGKQFKREISRATTTCSRWTRTTSRTWSRSTCKKHDGKVKLLRSFDPASPPGAKVPDPYYEGDDGFDHVLDLCTAACTRLLQRIREEHQL